MSKRNKNHYDRLYRDVAVLTEGEERIWSLYMQGVPPVRIAEQLNIKAATVRTKVHLIKEKLEDSGINKL